MILYIIIHIKKLHTIDIYWYSQFMIPTVLSIVTNGWNQRDARMTLGVSIDPSIYDLPSIQGEEIGGLASQEIETSNLKFIWNISFIISHDHIWFIWLYMIILDDHIRFKYDCVEILGGAGKRFTMQNWILENPALQSMHSLQRCPTLEFCTNLLSQGFICSFHIFKGYK